MAEEITVKVAYDFAVRIKRKLAVFKADLRSRGVPASERGIIERLIDEATADHLEDLYKKRRRTIRRPGRNT